MAHQHAPYEPLSIECVSELYRLISTREVRNEFPLFLKEVHTLEGGVFKLVAGEPEGTEQVFGAAPEAESMQKLGKACDAAIEDGIPETFGASEGEKITPDQILTLITFVKFLFDLWKNRKN